MYYHNNELPPQQGWVCPKCGRVNAPWLPTCGCVSSQTSGTPYLVETSSISQDSHEIAKTKPQISGVVWTEDAIKDEPKSYTTWASTDESQTVSLTSAHISGDIYHKVKDEPQTERSE